MAFRRKFRLRKRKVARKGFVKRSQYKLKYNARKATSVGAVKRVVKRVLANQLETKMQVYDWAMSPVCLQSGTTTMDKNYLVLNPSNSSGYGSYNLGQGTDVAQFTGNEITLKRAVLDYVFTLNNYNATTNPQMKPTFLRAYVYKCRRNPMNDPVIANYCGSSTANFFEQGAYDIGFTGQLTDLNSRINREAYVYLGHRTWKLGNTIPMVGSSPGAPYYTQSNPDFKMSVFGKWDITRFIPKKMVRDDVNPSPIWQQPYVFMLFQVVAADGTLYGVSVAPINLQLQIRLEYTDA